MLPVGDPLKDSVGGEIQVSTQKKTFERAVLPKVQTPRMKVTQAKT